MLCLVVGLNIHAGPPVTIDSPIGFFTNVASRLLKSQLRLDLNQIQIYPTNQYTPAVHRLLQLTANVYDAATNQTYGLTDMTNGLGFPTVFRPLFCNTLDGQGGGGVFICGYEEVTNADQMLVDATNWHDLNVPSDLTNSYWGAEDMVYGIPLVIGARQGWPTFNQFAMQTRLQLVRKLQFLRLGADIGTRRVSQTNQMYILGISNICGIEAWNSYSNTFNRALEIFAAVDVMPLLTNENLSPLVGVLPAGSLITTNNGPMGTNVNSWMAFPLYPPGPGRNSFLVPLEASYWILPNSEYSQNNQVFIFPPTGQFENPSNFPAPHWWLRLSVRVRYQVVDTASNRIVDYVNLSYARDPLDLSYLLMGSQPGPAMYSLPQPLPDQDEWITNHWDGSTQASSDSCPTYGIINQICLCEGLTSPDPVNGWRYYIMDPQFGGDINAAINFFRSQFGLGSPSGYSNVFYAPFSPVGAIDLNTSWQANDPLVHYTVADLTDLFGAISNLTVDSIGAASPLSYFGLLNPHYRPWGGNPNVSPDINKYNLALKDPLVSRSDFWSFPTNLDANLTLLGQLHRGTPWQTIYLKSPSVDPGLWQQWLGVSDPQVALAMHPTNDWRIASLLVALLSTNSPVNLTSVNQPNAAAWSTVLDGLTVLTNSSGWPSYGQVTMFSNSPQAAIIGAGLDAARSSQPGGYFSDVGGILAAPELSVASPWLNTNSPPGNAISDVAYEIVPSQLLTLLRPDSIGSIAQNGGTVQVQFTGCDAWNYAVQVSPDLVNWTSVSTNVPFNGVFSFSDSRFLATHFYRSVVLP